ncbi:MAG: SPOR domain-containing protein [Methylophilaceae bacterium]|nr:SPOR domain-containing protein [Methylophilaceae bacterium]
MAAEQLNDQEKQFRVRARRRLIGAIALVLLMVTVLPMVLDDRSGQRAPQPEIAISIPSQDSTAFPSKIVPVTSPSTSTPAVPMTSPVEKSQETPSTSTPPVPVRPAEPTRPVKVEPSVPNAPAARSASAAKPVDETKPAVVPPAASATRHEPGKGKFSVQVGVFSDAAKVAQMRDKIAAMGVQCYTESLDTPKGAKIRLRCGPYQAKTEAQQALDELKAAGFGGILVSSP